ncbi:MAG: helix-turn-helix transcriptional regulator [Candidatus Omnitrophica bacterium]|nr:helix-turn-helix transcriptional regulator [Candidatus Omnitrophota bacterium]
MKLYEKIRDIRESKHLSIQDVSNNILKIFGEKKAISYRTIYRMEQGHIAARFSSILQIAYALGVGLPTLLKGTELEDRQIIRRKDSLDELRGEGFIAKVVSSPTRSFLGLLVRLEPKKKMPSERSPSEGNYEKLIFVLKGTMTCIVGEEKHVLRFYDSVSFKSTLTHRFENNSKRPCEFLIFENPKHF